MLSTQDSNRIIDICCRIISTDGEVELYERIWMNKLCETNKRASQIAGAMLCPDIIDEDTCYT
jgi:hypothetical protein